MYGSLIFFSLIALSLTNNTPQQEIIVVQEVHTRPVCGHNEVLSDCVTPCQPSCEFPHQLPCPEFSARSNSNTQRPEIIVIKPLPGGPPPPPPSPCFKGCVCADGYVRNELGLCIARSECPHICKPYAHFEACGPRCQPSCDVPEPRSVAICTSSPNVCFSGCFCNSGYVKDSRTGQCVKPKDCSRVCPENEHYSDRGTTCVATCDNPIIDWKHCADHTVFRPGCYCNQGFYRDFVTKRCVRLSDCSPKSCPSHEQWYRCKPCTSTCNNRNPLCASHCRPGCDCSKGYVRNTVTNKCIPLCECGHH